MREVVLDTETTGLDPAQGHRVVEIGAIELVNKFPTDRTFHAYLDPERDMPPEAQAVHGLTSAFLRGKPKFASVVEEFLNFIGDAVLVIHNAAFDTGFLNWELKAVGRAAIPPGQVIDTLMLARQRHPMGPNSLDALCKRYGIDLSRRTRHGALLDSELLAEVYIELTGGKQAALGLTAAPRAGSFAAVAGAPRAGSFAAVAGARRRERSAPLPPRLTEAEQAAHDALVATLGSDPLWRKFGG